MDEVLEATANVVIVKVAVVAFAGTVTLAGNLVAPPLLLVTTTTAPPEGAGPFSVTVALDDVPPITEAGFRLTEVSAAAVTVKVAVFAAP
ncbi:MAG TPA: hypothetical protein VE779_12630 [Candidatus Angelobacter sp.]|nr:hypothetical protein [Candidatus Angelobacter sp.]